MLAALAAALLAVGGHAQVEKLVVGGVFTSAGDSGSIAVNSIAEWDGTAWSTLDGGVRKEDNSNGEIWEMTVYNGQIVVTGPLSRPAAPASATLHSGTAWCGPTWTAA